VGLDDQDAAAALREERRHREAGHPGADDEIVEVRACCRGHEAMLRPGDFPGRSCDITLPMNGTLEDAV
jgi:hypothetical protein